MKRIIAFIKKYFDITLVMSIALVLSKPNDNFILLTIQLVAVTIIIVYWILKFITAIENKFKKK